MVARMLIWRLGSNVDAYARGRRSPQDDGAGRFSLFFFTSLVSSEIRLKRECRDRWWHRRGKRMYDGRTPLPRLPLVRSFVHSLTCLPGWLACLPALALTDRSSRTLFPILFLFLAHVLSLSRLFVVARGLYSSRSCTTIGFIATLPEFGFKSIRREVQYVIWSLDTRRVLKLCHVENRYFFFFFHRFLNLSQGNWRW